jgi:MoaA/NifB/PqqE/SkfB family radical SAM enzyme
VTRRILDKSMDDFDFCFFSSPKEGKRIVWEITNFCNMKCHHCCASASSQKNGNEFILSEKDFISHKLEEIMSLGIKEFYISGGEPLTVENILEVLSYLKSNGAKISLATNAYLIDEEKARRLSEMKIDLIHVSLDGHEAKVHNHLRNGNFFEQVISNIKLLVDNGIFVRIGCTVWRGNEMRLEEMVRLCIELGVKELRFNWPVEVGRLKKDSLIYPKRSKDSILKEVDMLKNKYETEMMISMHRKDRNSGKNSICKGGKELFFLDSNGCLSPCSWISKFDNNFITKNKLSTSSFSELINSNEIRNFEAMIKKRKDEGCSGCPFIAGLRKNNYYANDDDVV